IDWGTGDQGPGTRERRHCAAGLPTVDCRPSTVHSATSDHPPPTTHCGNRDYGPQPIAHRLTARSTVTVMRVKLEYGTSGIEIGVPDEGVTVLAPRFVRGLPDEAWAFVE